MLLDFTVGNYRSFYHQKTLQLRAQKIKEERADNVAGMMSYSLLKTVAVYGANSSGKSNLVNAMAAMRACVLSSVRLNDGDALPYEPFLLLRGQSEPTTFEVTFLHGGSCYRYGFAYRQDGIAEEWLYRSTTPRSAERSLFVRTPDGIAVDEKHFPEGIGKEEATNANRLFLSLCAQLGGATAKEVMAWFQHDLNVVSDLDNQAYRAFSRALFLSGDEKSRHALAFFRQLQLGFSDLHAREKELDLPNDLPQGIKETLLKQTQSKKIIELTSIHNQYDGDGHACGTIEMPFDKNESSGTRKLFDMSGPLFDTLSTGSTLIVDELDAKMHPLISQQIIRLFLSPATNPHNAQLIFTTHDTHLLSSKILRRDQIWFTEKDAAEQTDLYCLTDIVLPDGTKPRNDANYERNYIAGRYGAIPYITNE